MIKQDKLYSIIVPVWLLWLFPIIWLIVIPGNFIIDSIVLLLCIKVLKINNKKQFYKSHILKVYLFGILADIIGAIFMFLMMIIFNTVEKSDNPLLTIPGVIIASVMMFIFNYFISFRKLDKKERLKLSIIFALATAPYTFLTPISWVY